MDGKRDYDFLYYPDSYASCRLFQHWRGDRGDLTIIPPSSRDGKGGVVATQQGMANVRDASVRFDEQTRVPLKGEERNELLVSYVLVPRTRREFYGELCTDRSRD